MNTSTIDLISLGLLLSVSLVPILLVAVRLCMYLWEWVDDIDEQTDNPLMVWVMLHIYKFERSKDGLYKYLSLDKKKRSDGLDQIVYTCLLFIFLYLIGLGVFFFPVAGIIIGTISLSLFLVRFTRRIYKKLNEHIKNHDD